MEPHPASLPAEYSRASRTRSMISTPLALPLCLLLQGQSHSACNPPPPNTHTHTHTHTHIHTRSWILCLMQQNQVGSASHPAPPTGCFPTCHSRSLPCTGSSDTTAERTYCVSRCPPFPDCLVSILLKTYPPTPWSQPSCKSLQVQVGSAGASRPSMPSSSTAPS